ncbi:MAG: iron ABC transporter permease [Desulfurococcales archaeon]|nr:iron ABC transporter permease [Desulfurococcales archaeon]MCE4605690.1 iron ABC transporter permease [Desulfurococcales archaeon]
MNRILGYTLILLFLLTVSLASLLIGPYKGVTLGDLIDYIRGSYEGPHAGVLRYRSIRTAAAILAGAALAGSGITLQYTLRNPLADPYLLGISSGAALGVLLLILKSQSPPVYGLYTIAFISGLGSFGVVVLLSTLMGLSATAMIVAGVSVSYLLGGVSMVVLVRLGDKIPGAAAWLFGTVAYVTPQQLVYTMLASIASLAGILVISRRIGTLILGEEMSRGIGINVAALRLASAALASLAASSIVAMAGPIGFIGLAGPWMARLLIGSWFPYSYPAALIAGAGLAVFSDVTVRLVGGGEIPLTAASSLYGGVILLYLTLRSGREL